MSERKADAGAPSPRFAYLGGDPSVDFVNTVDDRLGEAPVDRVTTYETLLEWLEGAKLARKGTIASLRDAASDDPARAERALRSARRLRRALYRIFLAAASEKPPDHADLRTITTLSRAAAARTRLRPSGESFTWTLDEEGALEPAWPVWKIVERAVRLLTSDALAHVRQCADPTCGWLFLDRSRNHSRRWCDMRSCGNRAKARRNYAQQKAKRAARKR